MRALLAAFREVPSILAVIGMFFFGRWWERTRDEDIPASVHPLAWRHPSSEPNTNPHLRVIRAVFDQDRDGGSAA